VAARVAAFRETCREALIVGVAFRRRPQAFLLDQPEAGGVYAVAVDSVAVEVADRCEGAVAAGGGAVGVGWAGLAAAGAAAAGGADVDEGGL
jgi:hypothetical protein